MSEPNKITIRIKEGEIRGIKEYSPVFLREYYSFYGIPYAEPPVKDLRFKDPVKVSPWKGIRNTTAPRDGCIQYSYFSNSVNGSEDCLYVNVYIPEKPDESHSAKAVIAFIHPGSLVFGSANPDGHGSPNFLMHHDVIYVTINYRLNVFGFLNLNLEECSGNQGLKDVIMAFQWIRENIHAFNGDPNNITAVGSSAGSFMIHLLLLSPSVKGLFNKAILMGLYAFNCLMPHVDDQTQRALEFAQKLGFKGTDRHKLLRFLKKIPAEHLINSIKDYQSKIDKYTVKSYLGGPFNESIDSVVVPVNPRQLIASMERMPIIFGICDRESICGFRNSEKKSIERKFHTVYRQNPWGWPHNLTDQELDQFNKKIHSFYLENLPDNATPFTQKIDIFSDAAFSEVYDTLIDPISQQYPVYVYKFQYVSELNELANILSVVLSEEVDGSFHGDDVCYWAHRVTPKTPKTLQVVDNFTKLLCSFAKTGNPNHESIELDWRPSTLEKPCYLDIDEKLTMVDGKLNGERLKFWDDLKTQFKHD